MKRWQLILLLLIAVWSVSVGAQEVPATYRVEVVVHPGDDGPAVAKGLAATYGGRLESPMDADHTVVMTVDDAVLTLLERDPRVVSVQRNTVPSTAGIPPALTPDGPVPQARTGTVRMQTNSTAAPWMAGPYKYDASGNIIEIGADRFVYDIYGRVKSGTVAKGTAAEATQEYWYDRYGNLTSVKTGTTTIPLTVEEATNRLTHHNGNVVSYDAAGQVLQASSSSFTYDGSGMMTSSGTSGVPSNIYIYTPSDERIASVLVSGNVEVSSSWSFRDASGRVLRRLDREGQPGQWSWVWRQDYIYSGNALLASENDSTPKTRHYFTDHLGSPRLITDNGGMQVGQHAYFPFGAEPSAVFLGISDTKRFTGHERDASGLDYMHARYYNWAWGRFLSVDPSRESAKPEAPQTWNRFSYAYNNPMKLVDPDGRNPIETNLRAALIFSLMKDRLDPKIHFNIAGSWVNNAFSGKGVKGWNFIGMDLTDTLERGSPNAIDMTFQYSGLGAEAVVQFDGIVPSVKEFYLLGGPFAKSFIGSVEDKFSTAIALYGALSVDQKLDGVLPYLFEYLSMSTEELLTEAINREMVREGYYMVQGEIYLVRRDPAK